MIGLHHEMFDGSESRSGEFGSFGTDSSQMLGGLLNNYVYYDMAKVAIVGQRALGVSFSTIWASFSLLYPGWLSPAMLGVLVSTHAEVEPIINGWLAQACPWTEKRSELLKRYNLHFRQPIPQSWAQAEDWIGETDELIALFKAEAVKNE